MRKRMVSAALALCLALTLFSGTALAADPDPAPVADTTTYTDWEDLFGVGENAYLHRRAPGALGRRRGAVCL